MAASIRSVCNMLALLANLAKLSTAAWPA